MKALKITIAVFTILFPFVSFAQGAPPATPIDGGIGLLLAGGVIYGIKKLAGKNKSAD